MKENDEIQSRREFFKNAAKATLPVIGFIALSVLPIQIKAKSTTDCEKACAGNCGYACTSCWTGCTGTCKGCSGKCEGGCVKNCADDCYGSCSGNCYSCKGGCSGGCGWQNENVGNGKW